MKSQVGNVFLTGDPPAGRPRRGRGRVVPVTPLPPVSARTQPPATVPPAEVFQLVDGEPPAGFTSPRRGWLVRADRRAGRLLARVAATRSGPLVAIAAILVILLLVGLLLTAGRKQTAVERRLASADSQLARVRAAAERETQFVSGWQAQALSDERQLAVVRSELARLRAHHHHR